MSFFTSWFSGSAPSYSAKVESNSDDVSVSATVSHKSDTNNGSVSAKVSQPFASDSGPSVDAHLSAGHKFSDSTTLGGHGDYSSGRLDSPAHGSMGVSLVHQSGPTTYSSDVTHRVSDKSSTEASVQVSRTVPLPSGDDLEASAGFRRVFGDDSGSALSARVKHDSASGSEELTATKGFGHVSDSVELSASRRVNDNTTVTVRDTFDVSNSKNTASATVSRDLGDHSAVEATVSTKDGSSFSFGFGFKLFG